MAPRKSTCGPLVRHSYVNRAAAALPFTAQAQESVRRVAMLMSTTPDEPESQALQSGTSLSSSSLVRVVMGSPPAGRSHWIRPSTRPRATMWWLDLAYAPHLRPEGRRRLFADAPRCLFLLTLHYGGLRERSSLICATTVCTVCEHAQPNSSRITSAPAHEDSLRRRIVQGLSAYFLAPNSRSRRQSSIKPSSCFVPIPATPLRSFARSTRARFMKDRRQLS